MGTKNAVLLFFAVCMGGIMLLLACRYTYKMKLSELKAEAKEAFIMAMNQEVKSRTFEEPLFFNFNFKGMAAEIPDSVCLGDSSGLHWYHLEPEKHRRNITDNTNLRSLHSYTFREQAIDSDSLNNIWRKYLLKSHISSESVLCISVTDEKGKVKSSNKPQCKWCTPSNLVFTVYIGYACEIEAKGYIRHSVWNMMIVEILFYSVLCILFVYGMYRIGVTVRKKITELQQRKIIELVKEIDGTPVRSYQLRENIIFYAERKMIVVDGEENKLSKQATQLLERFLVNKEKEYIVEDGEIMKTLWPDGSGRLERLHKAVGRLRNLLYEIDNSIDIKRNIKTYQLLI